MDIEKVIENCNSRDSNCSNCVPAGDGCPFCDSPSDWDIGYLKGFYSKLVSEPPNTTDEYIKISLDTTIGELDKLIEDRALFFAEGRPIVENTLSGDTIKKFHTFEFKNPNYKPSTVNIYEFATSIGLLISIYKDKFGVRALIKDIWSEQNETVQDAVRDLAVKKKKKKIAEFTVPKNLTV